MFVTIKQEKNTLGYQETMSVDIENIASEEQPSWRPIYEDIENSYSEETKLFPTTFLNQCIYNPNETHNIPNEIKTYLKKCLCNRGCMNKWL